MLALLGISLPGLGEAIEGAVDLVDGGDDANLAPCLQARDGPFSLDQVVQALRSNPDAEQGLRSTMLGFNGWDCLQEFRKVADTTEGVARASIALAHGGQDGTKGPRERRIASRLQSLTDAVGSVGGITATAEGSGSEDGVSTLDELLATIGRVVTGSSDFSAVERRAENTLAGAEAGSRVPTSTDTGFGTQDMLLFGLAAIALVLIVTNFT